MPPLSPVRQSSWTAASIGLARPLVACGCLSCSAFAARLQRFVPPNEEHNDWFLRLKAVPVIADARSDVAKATTCQVFGTHSSRCEIETTATVGGRPQAE